MNILEALQTHAETYPTSYFLHGRMVYPDEIFSPEGFMPLIARMAERRLNRCLDPRQGMFPLLGTPEQRRNWDAHDPYADGYDGHVCRACGHFQVALKSAPTTACEACNHDGPGAAAKTCGFSYLPFRDSIFMERIEATPAGENILEDSMRLLALANASQHVVGMGIDGTLDLTPVYDFFMHMKQEERDNLRREEVMIWPLYQPIQVS